MKTLDSIEAVDYVSETQKLHSLILWVKKRAWKYWGYDYREYNPHKYLSQETREHILRTHNFTEDHSDWLLEIAKYSRNDGDVIALSQNQAWEESFKIRVEVARRKDIPQIAQELLANDKNDDVLKALARNKYISQETTLQLWEKWNEDIKMQLLIINPYITLEQILLYWDLYNENLYYLERLLAEQDLPKKPLQLIANIILQKLEDENDKELSFIVSLADRVWSNPQLSQELRIKIFTKKTKLLQKLWNDTLRGCKIYHEWEWWKPEDPPF
jgi:hypothetical protein